MARAAATDSPTPYQLVDFVDGVGVFHDRIAPTHFPEHAHPEVSVDVCYENASCLSTWQTAGGRQLTRMLGEGNVSVLPGGQPHGSEWNREAEHLIFYLTPGFVERAARDLLRREKPPELVEDRTADDPLIRHLADALRAEMRRGCTPERLYVESLANVLAVHLLENYSAGRRPLLEPRGGLSRRVLARVTDFVCDNLQRDLTLSELAAVAGLSPHHFSRQFKRSTGLTPHRYVVKRRVERAREMLISGEASIPEVARGVGFFDQSHLARHTRRLLGVTPKKIRREGKNVLWGAGSS